ncbi:MAG: PilN domain-containing protein [Terriglobia bacterium]
MIRVNLIQPVGMPVETAAAVAISANAKKQGMALAVSALICIAIVGSIYWLWSHQIVQATQQLALERAEATRLARIQAENERFHVELMAIQAHIAIIQELNKAREGPKDLMTVLGATVNRANGLYLVSVAGQGAELKIHGESQYVNSIADFITALKQAGSFDDVQLQRLFEDDHKDRVNFTFDLTCVYKPSAKNGVAGTATVPGSRASLR